MNKITIFSVLIFSTMAFSQENSTGSTVVSGSSTASEVETSASQKQNLRLDLALYQDSKSVKTSVSSTEKVLNSIKVFAKYTLTNGMYFSGAFVQSDGQVTTVDQVSGSRTRSDISGIVEPTLEYGFKQNSQPFRLYTGLLYRFDTGSAKSTAQTISPKDGGQAAEPFVGFEADIPGYLLALEYRYTIEGERISETPSDRVTAKNGNKSLLYGYIEMTHGWSPGLGLAYIQTDTATETNKTTNISSQNPGNSKLYGEVYLQIPTYENLTLVPLLSYSQVLENKIQGVSQNRNDNLNITITARAMF